MAPELASDPDHVSKKADVPPLGMVLREMLALRTPLQHLPLRGRSWPVRF